MSVSVSIIIPVYNRQDELENLLLQLARQGNTSFEVVIVDDGSEPPVDMEGITEALPFPVLLQRHERCCGVGKARNSGVMAASGKLLIFVDSDGDIADRDWFEKHCALHEEAKGLTLKKGGQFCVVHSEVQGVARSWWGKVDGYSNWYGSTGSKMIVVRDRHVPTHNTSVEKAVFDDAGLFDEELEVLEDVEWSLRCLKKGIPLYYLPGAPVRHLDRESFKEVWKHYERFGRFAPGLRRKLKDNRYSFLYPRGVLSAILLFFPLTVLITLHILLRWLFHRPRILLYVPGLYIANVAYFVGLCRGLLKD